MDSILDVNGNVRDYTFVLSTKDYRHLGTLQNIDYNTFSNSISLSTANTFSFEIYKTVQKNTRNGVVDVSEPLWDEIINLKTIYIPEIKEYYDITVQLDDTTDNIKKTVYGTSLCESELGQVKIYGLEINSEIDIDRDDYSPTIFYNPDDPSTSLLDRVLSFMPQYKIAHVDKSLCNIQRTFSVDEQSIYDWLNGECAKEIHCLFLFDSTTRSIYVYDLYSVCNTCGYRGEYIDECPECGSTDLDYFGEDTDIYIDKENLTDAIQLTVDTDSIKNCLKFIAGDDTITSTAILLNPNGTDFIYMPTDSQLAEMTTELREKIISYNELYSSSKDNYEGIIADIYNAINQISYYTNTMMPTIENAEVTAQTEADKLTVMNLSPLGLSSITTSTSKATVESALKNYARVFVKTGYVKLDINQSNYNYIGLKADGWNHGTWTGNFKVTNYSDEEDIVYSEIITVDVYDNYQDFVEQKIMKNIATNSDEEDSVFDVLSISELGDFKDALKLYCLKRLESFYDAIQSALDVLIEVDQASENADLYDVLYLPYYEKLQACQTEIDARQITIDEWQNTYDNLLFKLNEMQAEMNFRDYLGEELYGIFCLYRREETYRNDNYISDGLTNSEIVSKAKEFFEIAEQELELARIPKISITSTLYNFLLMPEFKPIVHKFKLGNWLRICVDGEIYRLMFVGCTKSGSSEETLYIEFANASKISNVKTDVDEILSNAESMSKTYNYITNQASQGSSANEIVNSWFDDSLKSGLVRITNNVNEEIVSDKHGLWARTKDDITQKYLPEQFRLTHNVFAFTDNDWLSTSLVVGKHNYVFFDEMQQKFVSSVGFGVSAKFLNSPYIHSGQIIGSKIYSENYSPTTGTYIDLVDGTFNFGGGALKWDGLSLTIDSPSIPTKVSQLTNDSGYQNSSQVTTITKNTVTTEYVNALNVVAGSVAAENITGTTISGKIIGGGSIIGTTFNNGNGTFSVDTSGNAVANSFTSSNANITGGGIYLSSDSNDVAKITVKNQSDNVRVELSPASLRLYDKNGNEVLYILGSSIPNIGINDMVGNYMTRIGTYGFSVIEASTTISSMGTSGISTNGNLTVGGTKSRIANTEDYGDRLLYCYETPSPMFGDLGEGQIDETGKCYVFLDDIFAETIDSDCTYQVFLQPYGKGECCVIERNSSYFVVEGTLGLSFGWELKAIQKEYDTMRLEEYVESTVEQEIDVLVDTTNYLNSLLYNVESEEF